mgnify:FL=1
MNKELKDYLTDFFSYNQDKLEWKRKKDSHNRLFKWGNIKEDLNLINSLNPSVVLDLGCGDNRYKPVVKNLIGIDICDRPGVDVVSDFTELDFEDNSIDAIIAYGSINFGDEDLIEKQLIETKRVLRKDGIICFRGYSSNDPFYYCWTKEKCIYFTEKLGFDLISDPEIVNRLNRKGEAKSTWRDKRYEKLHNKDKTKRRDLTRLHWRWQK